MSIATGPRGRVTPPSFLGTNLLKLVCSRKPDHTIQVLISGGLRAKEGIDFPSDITLRKVGQVPSHAEIANMDLSELVSVMDRTDRAEFIRSNGLAAVGVHVGAFVYLRRLFERALHRVQKSAGEQFSTPEFNRKPIDVKIKELADFLPPFMVEQRVVYSYLSGGIHSWTEDSCGQLYPVLRESILLMLKQEKAERDRKRQEKELAKAVAQIDQSKLG